MKEEQTCKKDCPWFNPDPTAYVGSRGYGRCRACMHICYGDSPICNERKRFVIMRDEIRRLRKELDFVSGLLHVSIIALENIGTNKKEKK